ncbi:type VI secretion system accessory protein TagJ [Serratia sp. DD3]|uniref:type VI secretion system accessory protein TagJ n=1 Tax=Serratia sp. DD3 TaxID=1410619 RepID=UPI0003C50D69|nr:type VI secretion system accessory protein TagJ [Serratia sp. DD3]KEY58759.1 protein of avirulence locus involved in temperature-dependent protein secretion [Serratia sp. DD3]
MKSLLTVLKGRPLSSALAEAESQVKASPNDADKRASWVQLLLLYGAWPRAQAQLKAWQALAPIARPTTQQLSEAVTAEIEREQVLRGEIAPAFLNTPTEWQSALAKALLMPADKASELRALAYQQAEEIAGSLTVSGQDEQQLIVDFSWLADADSRLGPICELFVDHHYYWVPFQDIESINFQPPQNTVHLIWAHAMVKWRSGQQQVCQIPARYPLSENSSDSHRLGHRTDWYPLNEEGHYAGQGQKSWLTDNDEYALLTVRQVQFVTGE